MRKHKDTYSETGLHTIHLVNTPKRYRLVRNYLLVFLGIFIIILCLPWQQNVQGKGKLTPFSMADRPQTIPSILAGRIDKWFVQEGQFVKKGDTICVITEVKEKFFDPKLLSRTSNQIANKEDAVDAKKQKIINLQRQIEALKNSLKFKLEQSKNKVKQVRYKVAAEKAGYEAAQVNLKLAQDQYTRLEGLFNKGLASLTELQNRNNKTQEATAKMVEAENKYNSVQNELINAEIELNSVEADYIDKISKAESVVNETTGELLESRAEISKMQIELSNLELRSGFYVIRAPQEGYIVKAYKSGIGENIKEGEALISIVPSKARMAVELYVRAMDLPLMQKGVKVRVQFDGWPALVFSGWPNAGVGTFGGIVQVIDRVNSANGQFRVLVVPDPNDEPWPEQVRAGSGVYGWAMLKNVSIGYELWRQFNGFPPDYINSLESGFSGAESKEDK
ncbi:MAG: HlyD family efflux transporter periplasmic adaptor subunit [Bacteroidia bacterium]|nr:HlyD family efflux transporter periplasmic adaptor subunit [Bacteroidia bacterium]